MISESQLKQIADEALTLASGFDAELTLGAVENALTRFGDGVITQNVSQETLSLSVRLMRDGRMGKAATGDLTSAGLKRCIEAAGATLEFASPDPELLPLIDAQAYTAKPSFADRTLQYSPEERADGVARAVNRFKNDKLTGAGIFSTGGNILAIANSNGLWACHQSTGASFSVSAIGSDSSGWARDYDKDVYALDLDGVAEKAARKAVASRNPKSVDPGAWTVILEPAAVADAFVSLAWNGFNGKCYSEGQSAFSGKAGERVAGENITLTDDAFHPLTPGQPFDYEGMPRQRVSLIEKGIFKGVVHDRITSAKVGVKSTGHAMPQPDSEGPAPVNIVLAPGSSTLEEMIASTEKGLLVTRLHYTNILDPMKLIITGMTRDGLFLIEKGKVIHGVKNMRFTESLLTMLNNVEVISSDLSKTDTFWGGGGTVAPAIKINQFHFTSRTEN